MSCEIWYELGKEIDKISKNGTKQNIQVKQRLRQEQTVTYKKNIRFISFLGEQLSYIRANCSLEGKPVFILKILLATQTSLYRVLFPVK